MVTILVILAVSIILLLFIAFSSIHISIYFQHHDGCINLTFAWLQIFRYKKSISLHHTGSNPERHTSFTNDTGKPHYTLLQKIDVITGNAKKYQDQLRSILRISKGFIATVKVPKLVWHSVIGTGDAMLTGMAASGYLSIKSYIFSVLSYLIKFRTPPVYSVTPNYQETTVDSHLSCIFHFPIGKAIWAGFRLLLYWKRIKRDFSSDLAVISAAETNEQSV
ncbi:DUF2953 domain-containing protein [Peribacillus sp. SCS-155]|uniref:DUF2953 domain-containing protein n=1 Tax=Peribacillus sedimenti TaxID=3115297 RepID=UPI0039064EB3